MRPFLLVVAVVAMAATLFSTQPAGALPSAPVGLSPNQALPSFGANPELTWTGVPGATGYGIQIADNPGFSTLLYNEGTHQNKFTPYNNLPYGTMYWRVYSIDGSGNSANSAVASFVVTKPDGPVQSAPAAGATLHYPSQPPTFTWSAIPGTAHYYVDIATSNTFTSPTRYSVDGPRLTLVGNQAYNQQYFWRVQAQFINGAYTAFSATRSYSVDWLAKPVLVSPADHSTIRDIELVWQPVQGASRYLIEVSRAIDFTGPKVAYGEIYGTRYSPANTWDNGSYYWHVRPVDAAGNYGTWSDDSLAIDPFVFTRGWPDIPTLVSPNNGATATDPVTFQWTPIQLASYYQVQVGTDPGFTDGTFSTCTAIETRVDPYGGNGDPGGCFSRGYGTTYYWRVRGIDTVTGVYGLWSQIGTFIRRNAKWDPVAKVFTTQNTVTPLTPANATTVTGQAVLTWKRELVGVAYFHVKVMDKDGNVASDFYTYSSHWTPNIVLTAAASPYSWYVTPVGSDGREGLIPNQATWSTFSVAAAAASASAVNLLTPANAAADYEMPAMTWQPRVNATHYLVKTSVPGSGVEFVLADVASTGFASITPPYTPGNYDWWVEAYQNNTFLAASASRVFTVKALDEALVKNQRTQACDAITHVCANTIDLSSTPLFQWDPVKEATSYVVYLAVDANFTSIVRQYTVVTNEFIPQEEFADNTAAQSFGYFWHVRPCFTTYNCSLDPQGRAAQSANFTKRSKAYTAAQMTPADNAKIQIPANPASGLAPLANPAKPTFSWPDYLLKNGTGVNDQIEVAYYQLQVATDEQFQQLVDQPTVDQNFYTPWALTYPYDVDLHWRIRGIDGSNNYLAWSPSRTFQRQGRLPVPVAPLLDEEKTGVPTFSWQPLDYTGLYRFELYRNADTDKDGNNNPNLSPQNLIVQLNTPALEITPFSALPPGTYAWRVSMADGSGRLGPWANTPPLGTRFKIVQPAPSLVAPLAGATFTSDNIVFSWQGPTKPGGGADPFVDGAAYYRLQVSSTADFSAIIEDRVTVMNEWAPTGQYPPRNASYYWRVKAYDGAGNDMGTSNARPFTQEKGLPTAPTAFAVANAAGGFTIGWGAPNNPGSSAIQSYIISLSPAPASMPLGYEIVPATQFSKTYGGLTNGATYQVKVAATNLSGTGPVATAPGSPNGCGGTPFSDVFPYPTTAFCAEIAWLFSTGTTQGTTVDGQVLFQPNAYVSRLAMASFLWRTAGSPSVSQVQFFADVAPGSVPQDKYTAIQWMGLSGLSLGTPNLPGKPLYKPGDNVSRQAMAAFLYRFDNSPAVTPHAQRFVDVLSNSQFYNEIQWMGETGLSTGTANPVPPNLPYYKPADPVSRQAMAAFLFRFHNL